MQVIYADFNDIDAQGALALTGVGSLESLRSLPVPLHDGEQVWLSDGELWAAATVHRGPDGVWEARSDWRFLDPKPADKQQRRAILNETFDRAERLAREQ